MPDDLARHDRHHPGPGHPVRRRAGAHVPAARSRRCSPRSARARSASRRPKGRAPEMDFFDRHHQRARLDHPPVGAAAARPASPASIRSAPASSTSGWRARCWPAPSPAPRPPPSPARPGSGSARPILISVALALVHGFASITHRGNQIVSGVAINFIAAGSTIILGQAWFQQGGRTPSLAAGRPLRAITLPGADAVRGVPIIGPIYSELLSGHSHAGLHRLPDGAVHLVGAVPHPLRAAAARRRRKPGGRRHGRHLGRLAALPGA